MTLDRPNHDKPVPHPPTFSAEASLLAKKHHLDPRLVQEMMDKGVLKT